MSTIDAAGGATLSTHVLDTSLGAPAAGVRVWLEAIAPDGSSSPMATGVSDGDGRLRDFAGTIPTLPAGTYRLRFDIGAYFRATNREGFFPEVVIVFRVTSGTSHYHIPLLVSPFGYTTYRGS